jgi:hypothetical protein
MLHGLMRVLGLLQANGIEAVPFKGLPLAVQAYGDIALRHACDIDILVRPGQLERAANVLMAGGYIARRHALPAAVAKSWLARKSTCSFRSPSGHLIDLADGVDCKGFPCRITSDWLWEALETVSLEGQPVPALAAGKLLLVLCAHGARHMWCRPVWIADVAGLIARQPMDWPWILERAHVLGLRRMLILGLELGREVLGVAPPPEVDRAMAADGAVRSLAAQVHGDLLTDGGIPPDSDFHCLRFHLLVRQRFHLLVRERLRDRMRHIWKLGFVPSIGDWKALPLPPTLTPLYYLFRPFRLTAKLLRRR